MATKNVVSEVEMVSCEVFRDENGLDIEKFLEKARETLLAYEDAEKEASAAVVEAIEKVFTSEKPAHKALKKLTAGELATMALGIIGEIPNAKALEVAEVRVRNYMRTRTNDFLCVKAGRNSGYWFRDRLKAEEIAKLQKSEV